MYNSQFSCHRCRLGASLTIPEASLFPFLSHLHLCCCSRQGSVGGHVGHPTVPWSVESLNMEFFTIQMISFNTLLTSEVDLSILLFLLSSPAVRITVSGNTGWPFLVTMEMVRKSLFDWFWLHHLPEWLLAVWLCNIQLITWQLQVRNKPQTSRIYYAHHWESNTWFPALENP